MEERTHRWTRISIHFVHFSLSDFILRAECIRSHHPLAIIGRLVYFALFVAYYTKLDQINKEHLPEGGYPSV